MRQTKEGITLLPGSQLPDFKKLKMGRFQRKAVSRRFLFRYLFNYKNLIIQLCIRIAGGQFVTVISLPF